MTLGLGVWGRVVGGLLTVARSSIDGRMGDLGTGTLTSIRALVEHVVQLAGSDVPVRFGAVADRPFERPRAARTDQTRELTGWVAATPLVEGLRRRVAW